MTENKDHASGGDNQIGDEALESSLSDQSNRGEHTDTNELPVDPDAADDRSGVVEASETEAPAETAPATLEDSSKPEDRSTSEDSQNLIEEDEDYYIERSLADRRKDSSEKLEEASGRDEVNGEASTEGEVQELEELGDDGIIYQDAEQIGSQQAGGLVNWRVEDLYKENGKVRGQYDLRMRPPVLVVDDSFGNSVEFMLTKDTSEALSILLKNVHRAYFGIKPIEDETLKDKVGSVREWMKSNPVKTVIIGAVFAFVIIYPLIMNLIL